MADVLTATNGRLARALRAWMARATSSLPTPVSPVTSTGALDRATKSIAVCSAAHRRARRRRAPCRRRWPAPAATRTLSLGCRRASSAPATILRSSSTSHGLTSVPERAALDGVDRLVDAAGRGDDDDGQRRVALLDPVEQLEPVSCPP